MMMVKCCVANSFCVDGSEACCFLTLLLMFGNPSIEGNMAQTLAGHTSSLWTKQKRSLAHGLCRGFNVSSTVGQTHLNRIYTTNGRQSWAFTYSRFCSLETNTDISTCGPAHERLCLTVAPACSPAMHPHLAPHRKGPPPLQPALPARKRWRQSPPPLYQHHPLTPPHQCESRRRGS